MQVRSRRGGEVEEVGVAGKGRERKQERERRHKKKSGWYSPFRGAKCETAAPAAAVCAAESGGHWQRARCVSAKKENGWGGMCHRRSGFKEPR